MFCVKVKEKIFFWLMDQHSYYTCILNELNHILAFKVEQFTKLYVTCDWIKSLVVLWKKAILYSHFVPLCFSVLFVALLNLRLNSISVWKWSFSGNIVSSISVQSWIKVYNEQDWLNHAFICLNLMTELNQSFWTL